ncbi:hypothetical protein J6590_018183 [Homalodisca vitripennis]|nr:hypothetical protein J6590_018183 [Homalodisca vitripennis]
MDITNTLTPLPSTVSRFWGGGNLPLNRQLFQGVFIPRKLDRSQSPLSTRPRKYNLQQQSAYGSGNSEPITSIPVEYCDREVPDLASHSNHPPRLTS